jgi:hypothetical protein
MPQEIEHLEAHFLEAPNHHYFYCLWSFHPVFPAELNSSRAEDSITECDLGKYSNREMHF